MTSPSDLFAPDETVAPAAQGYVLAAIGRQLLAIPQADVLTIEHGGELAPPLSGEAAVGWFESQHGPWPVFVLERTLQLTSTAPAEASFLVFLRASPQPIGLLCTSVRLMRRDVRLQALPALFRDNAAGVTELMRLDGSNVALVLNAGALARYMHELVQQREKSDAAYSCVAA